MRFIIITLLLALTANAGYAQSYVAGKTQHRFAQTHVGLGYMYHPSGGNIHWRSGDEVLSGPLPSIHYPQFRLGGLHFWGHLDFVMHFSIPFGPRKSLSETAEFQWHNAGDLAIHYYPWAIRHGKIRPFVGVTGSGFRFVYANEGRERQSNFLFAAPEAGLSWAFRGWQMNLQASYQLKKKYPYYIDRLTPQELEIMPWQFSLSLVRYFDTTLREEKDQLNGKTEAYEQQLLAEGKLNSLSIGLGGSSAFFLQQPQYDALLRQSLPRHQAAFTWDLGLGYLWHRAGLHVGLAYRDYSSKSQSFGYQQIIRRRSVALEGFKFLWNYKGFAPFLGVSISHDSWATAEFDGSNQITESIRSTFVQPGIIFGWDILPSPLETWVLRTNLRYYPGVKINGLEGQKVRVDQLEFNFIQFVLYPQRLYHVGKLKRHRKR